MESTVPGGLEEERFQELVAELTTLHAAQLAQLRGEVAELRSTPSGKLPSAKPTAAAPVPVVPVVKAAVAAPGRQHQLLVRESCSPEDGGDEGDDGDDGDGRGEAVETELTNTNDWLDASIPEDVIPEGKLKDANDKKLLSGWVSPLSLSPSMRSRSREDTDDVMDLQGLESEILNQERQTERALVTRVADIFLGPRFEFAIAILLIINLTLMAAQLQYHGHRIGHEIGYRGYTYDIVTGWPHMTEFFLVGDILFAGLFTMEMLIRLMKIGLSYFKNFFNWIDFLVVCSSWTELFAAALPISPTFLRMLRLGKLLRALRVVKMSQVLESLQLLLKCIYASLRILFWSLVLLLIIQCSAGMTISYMLSDYMTDDTADPVARFAVFRYYGTFTKTLLTMFEVLFANWAPACRVLIDNVSEWYSLVFIVYRCFVGFAVLNVVNAVFVQSTMKVAQADEEVVAREKARTQETYQKRVTTLFRQVDTSGDGNIDIKEFERLLEHPRLQLWLHQLEIETTDLVGLFNMLDDGDGEISLEEFESGILRIKGMARSFDVNKIQRDLTRLSSKMDLILCNLPHTKALVTKMDKKKIPQVLDAPQPNFGKDVEQVRRSFLRFFFCSWNRDNQYYKAVNRELKRRLRSLLEHKNGEADPAASPTPARFVPITEDRVEGCGDLGVADEDGGIPEISGYYARQYSQQEIQQYWNQRCRPVSSRAEVPEELPNLERLSEAKVSFCPDPKKSGAAFTAIYEKVPEDAKLVASVNAGNPKKLKVGGGTINGQFAQELLTGGRRHRNDWMELHQVAGHDPEAYSPMHEGLLRMAMKAGTKPRAQLSQSGLFPAPSTVRLPPCLEAAFLYLGSSDSEAQEVATDPGRGGLVILDIFEERDSRPYHAKNVAMVYTVGPQRMDEADDASFLLKVRLVGRNVVRACHDYNSQLGPRASLPPIERMRLCLVSGGKFAGRVPKD
eukprot:s1127_g11.t2